MFVFKFTVGHFSLPPAWLHPASVCDSVCMGLFRAKV